MDPENSASPAKATLASLPPELALRIASSLDPQSLVRLGRTCASLHAVARTESLWKAIVLELVTAHGQVHEGHDEARHGESSSLSPTPPPPAGGSWYDQAKALLPHSHHLGYFASSLPYSSRIVRVAIMTPTLAPPPADAPPPSYFIRAAQLMPRNAFQNPLYPILGDLVPFGSSRDPLNSAAYVVNHRLNLDHPYSGLSVDVLEPTYDTTSSLMFDITPSDGPCLTRGNSSTAQGIAAAASRRNPSSSHHSAPFLRLALDPVTHRVERNSAATHPDGPASTTHEDLNREALFALFSGRLPRRQWPTLALVGLEEVNTADVPSLRAGRTDPARNVLRVAPGAAGGGGGAFRGLVEALTQRDGERPLAEVVQPGAGAAALDDEAFVTGFRLRAKRTSRVPPSASSSARGTDERGETSASAGTGERWAAPGSATRRRGVGGNGGPAVLWQGREEDPDEEPQVTILRAGDEGEGGFVLRVPGSPPQRRARRRSMGGDVPMLDGTPPEDDDSVEDEDQVDSLAEAIDSTNEAFFPIKAPARPLSWTDPSPLDEHGDVYASSLEGLWLGTYGGHGLEFVNLSTGFVEMPAEDEDGAAGEEGYDSSDSEGMDRRVQYRRVITATKVTGDPNVPSGQTSWVAILPPSAHHSHPLTTTVPSISLTTFQEISALDPLSTAYQSLNSGAGPDWSVGTARAYGRIALTGFASPSWTGAQVRFLRHEVRVSRGGRDGGEEDEKEERTVESIEEIHLRWDDLQKVGVFRRVRI